MANAFTLKAIIDADASKFEKGIEGVKTKISGLGKTANATTTEVGGKMVAAGAAITGVGAAMTKGLTEPIVGFGVSAVQSATDFETAFTGVRKTVDTSEENFTKLSDSIKKMAENTGVSKEEIAAVMETAGQMGVEVGKDGEVMEKFTKTMVDLGQSTDLSAQEAASALARFNNIFGESNDNVDRLGSTMVALGNNFATTEPEIMALTTRLAGAGKQAGLTQPEVMGMAAAMSSMGIEAEAGGTAMSQTMNMIGKAVASGGDAVKGFADVAGMSAEEFANKWKTKPAEAMEDFIRGLGKVKDNGGNVSKTLDDLGIKGLRQADVLTRLSGNADLLGDAIDTANSAYEENTALSDEANKRYETTENKLAGLKEAFDNVKVTLGETLLPIVKAVADKFKELADKFQNLSPHAQKVIVIVLAIVAALGPVIAIIGAVITVFGLLTVAAGLLGVSIGALAAGFLLIPLAIAAVVAGVVWLIKHWDLVKEKAGEIKDIVVQKWNELKDNVTQAVENLKQNVSEKWEALKQDVQNKIEALKTWLSTTWTNIKTSVTTTVEGLKQDVINKWTALKTTVTNTVENIKTNITNKFTAAKNTVLGIFDSIKSGIQQKIDAAKEAVRTAIDRIKSICNFSWSLPHLKLPHPHVSGRFSINPPSVPHFSISWYKKAAQSGMIFNTPTLFGAGDANQPEAVIGTGTLYNMVRSAVSAGTRTGGGNGGTQYNTFNIYGAPGMSVDELADAVERKLIKQTKGALNVWA